MNKRTEQAFCLALLIFSVVVRCCCSQGFELRALACLFPEKRTEAAPVEVYTVELLNAKPEQTAVEAPITTQAEPEAPASLAPQPDEPEPPSPVQPLTFTAEEATHIGVSGNTGLNPDRQTLLCRPSGLDFSGEGPKVLIVHTHSSEAYTPEPGWEYTPSDELRTGQPEFSVIRLGCRIAELLNTAGIETLHDTALNDYPVYSGSYDRMLRTIEGYLAQYPTIQMVLDIHRDAASNPDGTPFAAVSEQNGERCAKLMLVIGTDGCGMPHPDWQENLANALKLQALVERNAPGLCRDIDLRTERFNQHETPGSMIVEFGSTGNTLQEALRSADYLSAALIQLIQVN